MSGWGSLTPIEKRIVGFVAEGYSNPEIGERVGLSPRTIQWYLDRVFKKVTARSRAHLAAIAVRQELGGGCLELGGDPPSGGVREEDPGSAAGEGR